MCFHLPLLRCFQRSRSAGSRSNAASDRILAYAESFYEAAVEAMAAFRRSVLAEMPLGSGTRLTIRVKAPEEEHTITIGKVLSWLDGVQQVRARS
jgi:hypothetical protein